MNNTQYFPQIIQQEKLTQNPICLIQIIQLFTYDPHVMHSALKKVGDQLSWMEWAPLYHHLYSQTCAIMLSVEYHVSIDPYHWRIDILRN